MDEIFHREDSYRDEVPASSKRKELEGNELGVINEKLLVKWNRQERQGNDESGAEMLACSNEQAEQGSVCISMPFA